MDPLAVLAYKAEQAPSLIRMEYSFSQADEILPKINSLNNITYAGRN